MAAKKKSTAKSSKKKTTSPKDTTSKESKKTSTTKTTSAKKATRAKKVTPPTEHLESSHHVTAQEPSITTGNTKRIPFRIRRSHIITIAVILIIIGLLYVFRSQFVVATVNGQPITRMDYDQQLQEQSGKQVMNSLVTKTLIEQEANREHVTVSDKEINDEINNVKSDLKSQGQTLDQALAMRGLTMNDLRDQIRIQKLIEKMLGKDIQVSDQEVNDYIQKNQISQDNSTGTPPLSKDAVRQQLQQQKLNAKFTPWLQKLQEKAKINYFINV